MADDFILGRNAVFSTDINKTILNNNIALIGCTGSGKSLHFVQTRFLNTYDTNLVVYDPKRELINKYRSMFEQRKYIVQEINLSEPMLSDISFDTLRYLSSDTDVSALAKGIVNLTPQSEHSSADRYWDDGSCNLAKFGIYYVLSTVDDANFTDFLDFINNIEIDDNSTLMRTSVDDMVETVKRNRPDHPMIAPYNSFSITPVKTAGCIFSMLKTTLSNVFNPDIKKMLKTKETLNIEKFIQEKNVLFITSDGTDEYVDAYVNLIFDMLINELSKEADKQPGRILTIPVHLIMDDFACGAKIKNFPRQISKFRSKGISSTIVLQSISQLTSMYGEAGAATILNNNDTLVYLGGNDLKTARDFAERVDLPIDRVLYMPLEQVMIFRRGSRPVITRKYPILQDKQFLRITKEYEKRNMLESKEKERFSELYDKKKMLTRTLAEISEELE